MIKFANKLELRYYFNDRSNYIDAMIKYRAEKEVLSLLRNYLLQSLQEQFPGTDQ